MQHKEQNHDSYTVTHSPEDGSNSNVLQDMAKIASPLVAIVLMVACILVIIASEGTIERELLKALSVAIVLCMLAFVSKAADSQLR